MTRCQFCWGQETVPITDPRLTDYPGPHPVVEVYQGVERTTCPVCEGTGELDETEPGFA